MNDGLYVWTSYEIDLSLNLRKASHRKTLSESLHILGTFKLNRHIDPDLFDVFVREKVYLKYAEQFLDASQMDVVNECAIPENQRGD